MKAVRGHKRDKIKELASVIKLGHADFRVHYNCGRYKLKLLDLQPSKVYNDSN